MGLNIVDGAYIDVIDESWIASVYTLGLVQSQQHKILIAVRYRDGSECAFEPVTDAQKILMDEIGKDLVKATRGA